MDNDNNMAFDQFMQDLESEGEQFMAALRHEDLAEGSQGGVMYFQPEAPSDGEYSYEWEQYLSEFPEECPFSK